MKEIFPIIPPTGAGVWVVQAITFLILIAITFLLLAVAVSSRSARVEVGPTGLHIRSPLYGRTIAWSSILADDARVVNLKIEKQFAPSWRTNGIGLPGYAAGWFRLKNGQKALAFITDYARVVLISTPDYAILVSVADAEALVTAVKRWAGSTRQGS